MVPVGAGVGNMPGFAMPAVGISCFCGSCGTGIGPLIEELWRSRDPSGTITGILVGESVRAPGEESSPSLASAGLRGLFVGVGNSPEGFNVLTPDAGRKFGFMGFAGLIGRARAEEVS